MSGCLTIVKFANYYHQSQQQKALHGISPLIIDIERKEDGVAYNTTSTTGDIHILKV